MVVIVKIPQIVSMVLFVKFNQHNIPNAFQLLRITASLSSELVEGLIRISLRVKPVVLEAHAMYLVHTLVNVPL